MDVGDNVGVAEGCGVCIDDGRGVGVSDGAGVRVWTGGGAVCMGRATACGVNVGAGLGNTVGVGGEVATTIAGVTSAGGGMAGRCRCLRTSTSKIWTRTGTY
jgi:hypothetical protein